MIKSLSEEIRVLLIEDDPDDAKFLQMLLSKYLKKKIELTWEKKLSPGLQSLKKEIFDVVLLDLSLPDCNGIETFHKIYQQHPYLPVVILSGVDDEELALEAVRGGAQDYLLKGQVDGHVLIRSIVYAVERKKILSDLEKSNAKLVGLDQLKSDFLSTVSHELRAPIAMMREGVSLCLDGVAGDINEKQEVLMKDTMENIDRLTLLINDMLDISKIESSKLKLQRSIIDLSEILRNIQKKYMNEASSKDIEIQFNCPKSPFLTFADHDKIVQIFDNLVSNALRFTDAGGKIILEAKDNKKEIHCSVSDTGIGIAKKNINRLFSKFEQFGREDGPGYRGTGLGLSIVRGLVERHQGKVWVESELGKGSTFSFSLKKIPLPKILIVDDSKEIVDVLGRILAIDHYPCLEAYNGKEGIEKALIYKPSLIILDLMLPNMNGYDVLTKLKNEKKTQSIPILMVSGFDIDEERLYKIDMNMKVPVLGKPIRAEELLHTVKELIMSYHDESKM